MQIHLEGALFLLQMCTRHADQARASSFWLQCSSSEEKETRRCKIRELPKDAKSSNTLAGATLPTHIPTFSQTMLTQVCRGRHGNSFTGKRAEVIQNKTRRFHDTLFPEP